MKRAVIFDLFFSMSLLAVRQKIRKRKDWIVLADNKTNDTHKSKQSPHLIPDILVKTSIIHKCYFSKILLVIRFLVTNDDLEAENQVL